MGAVVVQRLRRSVVGADVQVQMCPDVEKCRSAGVGAEVQRCRWLLEVI